MSTFVLFLAEVPVFAIYAVVGVVAGSLGGLIARPFKRHTQLVSLLPVVLIAASFLTMHYSLKPWLGQKIFAAGIMNAVGDLPRRIDEVTVLENIEFDHGTVNVHYRIEAELDDLQVAHDTIREMVTAMPGCRELTRGVGSFIDGVALNYETNLGNIEIPLLPGDCKI